MNEVEEKAWDAVDKATYGKTANDVDNNYTNWAKNYDEDLDLLGYQTPQNVVDELMKYAENSESAQLLDIGAGTGRCGELLKKHGYKGTMDALEINGAMLEVARSKNIYRNHLEIGVFPDTEIPLKNGLYDAVVCVGTLLSKHVESVCVKQLFHVLKPGGIAAWNTRNTEQENRYREEIAKFVEQMVESNQIVKIEVKSMQHYKANYRGEKMMMSIVYIYRKL